MSSPMPFLPSMCSLCFEQIYDGEYFIDRDGDKWNIHSWCHYAEMATIERKNAAIRREANNQPCIED